MKGMISTELFSLLSKFTDLARPMQKAWKNLLGFQFPGESVY